MSESLKSIVADLLEVSPDEVAADRTLSGARLQGSVGRAILDAAVRAKLGIRSTACYSAKTYGELESAITGVPGASQAAKTNGSAAGHSASGALPQSAAASAARSSGETVSHCGVDIEEVANLPATADYWKHEFYPANFTPGEIAYCLTQQSPLQHFAARWCAKEAVKKCEPDLIGQSLSGIEVVSTGTAPPFLRVSKAGSWQTLPHAVSLSHTQSFAIAMVVAPQPVASAAPAARPAAAVVALTSPRSKSALALVAATMALSLLALLVAVAALLLARGHR